MIIYQREEWGDVLEEMKPMFKKHWGEVGFGVMCEQPVKLDMCWEAYSKLTAEQILYVFTARKDKKLIGYCVFLVFPHLHSKEKTVAENDLLFLLKEYRVGFTGFKFIKFVVNELKKVTDAIFFSTGVHNSFLPILNRLGFKSVEYRAMLEVV